MTTENTTPNYKEELQASEENREDKFIADLFDDEGAFGEADCAGL